MRDSFLLNPPEGLKRLFMKRGAALEAYSTLEGNQALLLSDLLHNDARAAAHIYHRISNTKTRNNILEELILERVPLEFHVFWFGTKGTKNNRGLMNRVNELDSKRNQIVHWKFHFAPVRKSDGEGGLYGLVKPDHWLRNENEAIFEQDIDDFILRSEDAALAMHAFHSLVLNPNLALFDQQRALMRAWQDKFRQPYSYPIPLDHPEASPSPERGTQPQS